MPPDDKVYVGVSCGMFVGPAYWHNMDVYEPNECGWDDIVWAHRDEWEDDQVRVQCQQCGAMLEEPCHYEDVDAPNSSFDASDEDRATAKYWEDLPCEPPEPVDLGPTAFLSASVHRLVPDKGPTGGSGGPGR